MTGYFPDPVRFGLDVLAQFAPTGHIGRLTPDGLGSSLPFVQVGGVGGSDDLVTDRSTLDVSVFDVDIDAALNRAERIRQFLTGPGPVLSAAGVALDHAVTVSRPQWLPYGTPDVFRVFTAFRVSFRRAPALT